VAVASRAIVTVTALLTGSSRFMAHAHGGCGATPVAGLQPCDRSKITLISTTQPQEGGFGESKNLEFVSGVARL
jgi:hypothetical protein